MLWNVLYIVVLVIHKLFKCSKYLWKVMGRVCAAVNCTSRQKKDSGISFHEFPHKRPEVLKKWLEKVRREKWFPREKSSFLCSKHFLPDCFEGGRQTLRRLKDDAIPTVFDYTIKPRKKKLLPTARVKRLAATSAAVITSSTEKNQKNTSRRSPQQQSVIVCEDSLKENATISVRRSVRDAKNHLVRFQESQTTNQKESVQKNTKQEKDIPWKLCVNDNAEMRHSQAKSSDKHRKVKTSGNESCDRIEQHDEVSYRLVPKLRGRSAPSEFCSSGAKYQSVTIVPSAVNEDGEVSYRLIVQDCSKLSTKADGSDKMSIAKPETMNRKIPNSSKQRLRSSKDADTDKNPPMKCTHCSYTTRKRYLLSRHLRAHLEHHAHKCSHCPCSFKTLLALQNHVNTHQGVRPFSCRSCDNCFTTSGELLMHMNHCRKDGAVDRQSESPVVHDRSTTRLKHLLVNSTKRQYKCDECNEYFNDQKHFGVHKCINTAKNSTAEGHLEDDFADADISSEDGDDES